MFFFVEMDDSSMHSREQYNLITGCHRNICGAYKEYDLGECRKPFNAVFFCLQQLFSMLTCEILSIFLQDDCRCMAHTANCMRTTSLSLPHKMTVSLTDMKSSNTDSSNTGCGKKVSSEVF